MVQQGIDQRAVKIARGRMDHKAGRLVHHDQVLVLEHDGKGDVLGNRFCRCCCGHGNRKGGTGGGFKASLAGRNAIQRDAAFAHQRLDPLARQAARQAQRLVEPLAARQRAGNDAFLPVHC